MSGTVIVGIGIGIAVVGVILFVVSIIYRETAVKRIKRDLKDEYM